MRIKSFILENIFSYEGENIFQLGDKLNVIIGENGFGKTSFINALKICLHGITKDMLKIGEIGLTKNEYIIGTEEKFFSGILNIIAKANGQKVASVQLVFFENEELLKIKRTFKINNSSYVEELIICDSEDKILYEDEAAQDYINSKFINQNLANFFLFDGEKVQDISNFSNREFSLMLESVFKELKVLDLTIADMKTLKRKYEAESFVDTDLRLKYEALNYENDLKEQDSQEREATNALLKSDLREYKKSSTEIENKIKKISSDFKENLVALNKEKTELEFVKDRKFQIFKKDAMSSLPLLLNDSLRITVEADVLANYFDPNYISKELIQKKKIEFIEEINRRIKNNESVDDIMEVFDQVFLTDEKNQKVKFVNNSTISTQFKNLQLKKFVFSALLTDLKNDNIKLSELQKQINIIKNEIKENEIILDGLLKEKENVSNKIAVTNQTILTNEDIISQNKIRLKEIEKEIHSISAKEFKEESLKEKINICLKTIEAAEKAKIVIKEKRRESLEKTLNVAFKKLIKNGYDAAELKVFNDFTINVFDKEGTPMNILSCSSGQKQIIATALIWAITDYVKSNMPMVIDTPLGRLDHNNQKLLINNFYKSNNGQLILLPTPSEMRAEGFEDLIEGANVYTLSNKGSKAVIRKGL